MKKIKNINISSSRNKGKVVVLYETLDEVIRHMPKDRGEDGCKAFVNYAKDQLSYSNVIGVVEASNFEPSYPRYVRVRREGDDYEILNTIHNRFVDKPVEKEKILKRKW